MPHLRAALYMYPSRSRPEGVLGGLPPTYPTECPLHWSAPGIKTKSET
jgi:hypothetical protein